MCTRWIGWNPVVYVPVLVYSLVPEVATRLLDLGLQSDVAHIETHTDVVLHAPLRPDWCRLRRRARGRWRRRTRVRRLIFCGSNPRLTRSIWPIVREHQVISTIKDAGSVLRIRHGPHIASSSTLEVEVALGTAATFCFAFENFARDWSVMVAAVPAHTTKITP
eukprot:SAG31_NODE_143_length_22627_cov_14.541347_1_plen_164_part_00